MKRILPSSIVDSKHKRKTEEEMKTEEKDEENLWREIAKLQEERSRVEEIKGKLKDNEKDWGKTYSA